MSLNQSETKEKKKRGRKPKTQTNEDTKKQTEPRVRKRGRKPKYPIESISEIRQKFKNNDKVIFSSSNEQSTVIEEDYNKTQVSFGNLNITISETPEIDKEELRNMFRKQAEEIRKKRSESKELDIDIETLPPEEPSESEPESDNETTASIQPVLDDNYVYKEVENKRIYKQLYHFREDLHKIKQWPQKTDILCWWCCHSFDTIPIPSVIKYDYNTKKYNLKGIFCSWECSKAYTLENNRNTCQLYRLYREWTGDRNFEIQKAPPKLVLKAFGGYMDIEEFRKCPYVKRTIKISSDFNMDYVNQEILEVYTTLEKRHKNKSNLTLKRNKPLKKNF